MMRPVSAQINKILEQGFHNANFGLVFNKWLEINENGRNIFKTKVHDNRRELIEKYGQCIPNSGQAVELLKSRHLQQSDYCAAMAVAGYTQLVFEAELISPFISGLGMTHPTETGMVLDWDTGLPYIPASSQKGVLRLAYILDSISRNPEQVKIEKNDEKEEFVWYGDDSFHTLFGYTADRERDDGLVGRLVVLDAYPLQVPHLTEDILNPHYPDYYGKKKKNGQTVGPSEDQNPIPVIFLVVKPGIRFVFRFLLRYPLPGDPNKDTGNLVQLVRKAVQKGLVEEGLGSKTALGYGRFRIISESEPDTLQKWREERDPKLAVLIQINQIQDWGQLNQIVLGNKKFKEWQSNPEIAAAVKAAAERARNRSCKKWKTERDKNIAAWLTPAGIAWTTLEAGSGTSGNSVTIEATATPLLEKIQSYSDWGAYQRDPVDISGLDRTCALALRDKLRVWGCDSRRAKKEKQKAWKAVQKRLR